MGHHGVNIGQKYRNANLDCRRIVRIIHWESILFSLNATLVALKRSLIAVEKGVVERSKSPSTIGGKLETENKIEITS